MKSVPHFVLLILLFKSCSPTSTKAPLVNGKLVYTSCATIAVQILDPRYFQLGQPEWEAGKGTGKMITHVFAVANSCSFPSKIKIGQEFSFVVLKDDPTSKDCMVCEMYDYPPEIKQLIKVEE